MTLFPDTLHGRDWVAMSRPIAELAIVQSLFGRPAMAGRARSAGQAVRVGWGFKPSGQRASAHSPNHETCLLEDGFLRSIGRRDEPLSVVVDRTGIYYAARSQSRLFDLVARPLSQDEAERASAICRSWAALGLSKYNDAPAPTIALPERYALVIDQVRNDLSIAHGLADEQSFARMIEAAKADDPDRKVLLKIHPDSLSDPAKRHFDIAALAADPQVVVLAEPCHIAPLIAAADAVYTVTSQVGFEALMHGKPVHVFGMPFYAGWGLTADRLQRPDNREDASLEQLVHAALVDYPRYWNPVRRETIEVEEAMALVAHNRALRDALPQRVFAHGFSAWKRPFMAKFLSGSQTVFVRDVAAIPPRETLLLWGRRPVPGGREDLSILRSEDGFLRSSGLGADLVRPLSLVIDDLGIYYDSTGPSRLEAIIENSRLSAGQKERARRLREAIVAARLTKYNLGGEGWSRPAGERRVLLVVGQVEDDASIRWGSPQVKTNVDLLSRVRRADPDAYLVYKPHPDVVAGLRERDRDSATIATLCDEMVVDADPVRMFDEVDEVHTMTSLMGFEALMRGLPVTCYGMPFYAGWGLTDDVVTCERRTRRADLDEIVHAAFIAYPRYFSARGQMFASPEDLLVELSDLAMAGPATRSPWRKAVRPLFAAWKRWFS